MEISALLPVLQACLSHDQAHVKEAERILKQHEQLPGQAVQLLRVAAEESVDAGVRHMAAINFKNFVKRSWEQSDTHEAGAANPQYVIPDADKDVIRQNIVEALVRAPHAIQSQLSEVFKIAVYTDYPERWPGLMELLYANLSAQDQPRVHGGLVALRLLARKYEFRDEEERAPLDGIISAAFPLLLHIFRQLLAAPPSSEVSLYVKLVAKTWWSCTYMGVPAALLEADTFRGWMEALHSALTQPEPADVAALSADDRQGSPWWKTKKWILHLTYRLFNRYGQPKHARDGTDRKFADLYESQCMLHFLDAHLALMSQLASGTYFSPRCTNLLFQYMSHALGIASCYKRVGVAGWDSMLHNVAFPLMAFNDDDARLWVEDPQEYIRKGYDIMEDMYSPKTAAANFAHDLATKKRSHLDAFMGLVAGALSSYARAVAEGGAPPPAEARRVDGALLAVGCLAPLLKTKKPYKEQLGPIMATYVMPCFASPHGHLRSKAVWVSGVFCDTPFPDGTNQGPTYMRFFEQVVRCLADPELPVRVDAVVSLRHFLEEMADVEPLAPALPQLLNSIFGLMNQVDNEDLVFTLEALVDKFGEAIAPYAAQMAAQLAGAFFKYCTAADEDDERDEETAGIAAFGCMRALNTLLESCSEQPSLVASLEEILHPLLARMLSTEGQDVFEEVLEMLSYLTFYGPAISDRLWALWPHIEAAVNEWAFDYWENVLVPLDNYISRDTERFLTSTAPDYRASLFGMVSGALRGDYEERGVVPAAKLMEVVLQHCRGRVDAWVGPYLQLALARLQTATNRTLKDTLMVVVANALYYNAPLALSCLAAMGAVGSFFQGWFVAIFARKKSGKPRHFRRLHDKKMCVLGLVSLLAVPDAAAPPEIQAGMPQVLAGVVRLLIALKEQQAEVEAALKAAEAEGDEEDDDDDDEDEDLADDDADDDEEALKAVRRGARDLLGDGDDEDGSDDEFTDDEESQSPVDPIDPFVFLADALTGLQQHMPARHQLLMSGCDAGTQAALAGMAAYAAEMRSKAAAESK